MERVDVSLDDSLGAVDDQLLDEAGLVALFESVSGLGAADHPEAVAAYEAALRARLETPESTLESRLGGWVVDIKASTVKFAVSAALMTGVMFAGGFDQIPAYVLPAVLPLLIDVERAKLNRGERKLLVALRALPVTAAGDPAEIDALYDSLPATVREQLSPIEFAEFTEKLIAAGEVDEDSDGRIAVRENPKWIHISFD